MSAKPPIPSHLSHQQKKSHQCTKSLRDSPLKRVQEPLGRRPGGAVTS